MNKPMNPWPVGILAIDCAKNSGWSIWIGGKLLRHGEVNKDDHAAIMQIITEAYLLLLEQGEGCAHWLGLVLEKPPAFIYGGRGANTLLGLGAARQAWEHAWKEAGHPKRRIIRIEPMTWRKAVLGKARRGKNDPDDLIKRLERAVANRLKALPANDNSLGPDECAAIGLGYFSTRCGEVGRVLPKKVA